MSSLRTHNHCCCSYLQVRSETQEPCANSLDTVTLELLMGVPKALPPTTLCLLAEDRTYEAVNARAGGDWGDTVL